MSRCRHEGARQSSHMDEWLWCGECRQLVKKREVGAGIGDGR